MYTEEIQRLKSVNQALEARLAECEARLGININTPIEQLAEKLHAEVMERLEARRRGRGTQ